MTTVKIGMDQWAVARLHAQTNLYTADLSGCVALVLASLQRFGLTHVASDAGREWGPYEVTLNEMFGVINNDTPVRTAQMIANGGYSFLPFTLIRTWLSNKGLQPKELPGDTGIFVHFDGRISRHTTLSRDIQNTGFKTLRDLEAIAAIISSGSLSGQASNPSPATDVESNTGEKPKREWNADWD